MSDLPKGTLVRVMDWNSDYYMQTATVEETLTDGRLVLSQRGIRIGAFRPGTIVLGEPPGVDN